MYKPSIERRRHPAGAVFSLWQAPDGWTHRRLDWPQKGRRRPRGSLLFAGGRGDFIEKYLEPMAHWHERGWNVASFDWRGQGASRGDIEGGHLDRLDLLVDDLAALVAEWRASAPGPHVAVAHSMGGHVLLRLLAEQRVELDSAVFVAPMLAINSGPLPPWSASLVSSVFAASGWAKAPAWREGSPPPPFGSLRQQILTSCRERYEDELWWWKREPGFNLGVPSWGWLDAAYRSCGLLTKEKLGRVDTPLLILATDADRLVSAEAIRRAAGQLPNARLRMFADAAHELLREADPVRSEALAEIDAFLDDAAAR